MKEDVNGLVGLRLDAVILPFLFTHHFFLSKKKERKGV